MLWGGPKRCRLNCAATLLGQGKHIGVAKALRNLQQLKATIIGISCQCREFRISTLFRLSRFGKEMQFATQDLLDPPVTSRDEGEQEPFSSRTPKISPDTLGYWGE